MIYLIIPVINANATIKIAILNPRAITPNKKDVPIIIMTIIIPSISIPLNIDNNFFNKSSHSITISMTILNCMTPQTY